jgi:hypothetical protein
VQQHQQQCMSNCVQAVWMDAPRPLPGPMPSSRPAQCRLLI